jgi:DNA polymerase III delta prime subunit
MAPMRQAGKKILLSLAQHVVQPAAERVPTLVFLGPPGVGKGTYSLRIAKQLGLAHISVGDLIRHEIDIGTKPGRAVSLTRFVLTML